MSFGYKIMEPSGKVMVVVADDRYQARKRVLDMQGKWSDYCDRNWLNDTGDMYSPEIKVKRFLDSLAYYYMIGDMHDIETDYKKVMHAKREIPASNCPSFVDNILYGSGGTTDQINQEECASFRVMTDRLDAKAEKYETQKTQRKRQESKFQKHERLGIHGGEWCRVDTDGRFEHNGRAYEIDPGEAQYQPVETEVGLLYDMDRILVTGNEEFYDMNYDKVKVREL